MSLKVLPGHFEHESNVVLAENLYPEKLCGDEPEEVEVIRWPLSDIDALLKTEEFTEARSVAALLLVGRLLQSRAV
jgi:ADP-ribose diphosphatase